MRGRGVLVHIVWKAEFNTSLSLGRCIGLDPPAGIKSTEGRTGMMYKLLLAQP